MNNFKVRMYEDPCFFGVIEVIEDGKEKAVAGPFTSHQAAKEAMRDITRSEIESFQKNPSFVAF